MAATNQQTVRTLDRRDLSEASRRVDHEEGRRHLQ